MNDIQCFQVSIKNVSDFQCKRACLSELDVFILSVTHHISFLLSIVWQQCKLPACCQSRQPGQSRGVSEGGHRHQYLQPGKRWWPALDCIRAIQKQPLTSRVRLRALGYFLFSLNFLVPVTWSYVTSFFNLTNFSSIWYLFLELILLANRLKITIEYHFFPIKWSGLSLVGKLTKKFYSSFI